MSTLTDLDRARVRAIMADHEGDEYTYEAIANELGLEHSTNVAKDEVDRWYHYMQDNTGLHALRDGWDVRGSDPADWARIYKARASEGHTLEGLGTPPGDSQGRAKYAIAAIGKRHNRQHNATYGSDNWVHREIAPEKILTTEKIEQAIKDHKLSPTQKRNLLVSRIGEDLGINGFNNAIDTLKLATPILFDRSIEDADAAQYIISNVDSALAIIKAATAKVNGEEYSIEGINTDVFIDDGSTSFSIDRSTLTEFDRMTIPYDFERNSRYNATTEVIDGKRVETDDYYAQIDAPHWKEDPQLGTLIGSEGSDWMYSNEIGGYIYRSEESPEWFYSEDAKTWMYPTMGEHGVLFYANGTEPSGGEWLAPKLDGGGSYYDFDDKVYRTSEEIANFKPDPDTGIAKPAEKVDEVDSSADSTGETNITESSTEMNTLGEAVPYIDDNGKPMPDWYTDKRGIYYDAPGDEPGWKFRTGSLNGFFYDDPNSNWLYGEDTGWLWQDPDKSGDYYYSQRAGDWAYATKPEGAQQTNWLTQTGESFVFPPKQDESESQTGGPNSGEEPGNNIPSLISYDRGGGNYSDLQGQLTASKNKLNEIARDLSYEGFDQGVIMGMLKKTEVYKDFMDSWTNEDDKADARGLIDGIVEQVAEVNARKGNIATTLDMFDSSGAGMLDPRMTLEEKLAIRTAKPSRQATQADVDAGLATEVGQVIRNPDYDPSLSYYFEYRNPETGELETRSYRPDMPGKHSFMGIQEGLLDESRFLMEDHLSDLVDPIGDTGKSKYRTALDKQVNALQEKGIMAGGEDDPLTPQDESLGLYANEGASALNYVYGDDSDSLEGKMDDYYATQNLLREQTNFLNSMDVKRDLDNTAKLMETIDDLDPVERARDRSADRIRLARFGGGEVNKDLGGVGRKGGMYESQLDAPMEFADTSKTTGLGETYTQAEIDAAGIGNGLKDMRAMSKEMKDNNQYAKNVIQPKRVKPEAASV